MILKSSLIWLTLVYCIISWVFKSSRWYVSLSAKVCYRPVGSFPYEWLKIYSYAISVWCKVKYWVYHTTCWCYSLSPSCRKFDIFNSQPTISLFFHQFGFSVHEATSWKSLAGSQEDSEIFIGDITLWYFLFEKYYSFTLSLHRFWLGRWHQPLYVIKKPFWNNCIKTFKGFTHTWCTLFKVWSLR